MGSGRKRQFSQPMVAPKDGSDKSWLAPGGFGRFWQISQSNWHLALVEYAWIAIKTIASIDTQQALTLTVMGTLHKFAAAAGDSGRPLAMLLLEAVRLRFGTGRLGVSEYLDFQLYQNTLDWRRKQEFVGYRGQAVLEEVLVDDYSRFLSLDKVTMYTLMAGFKLPIPPLKAVFGGLRPQGIRQLANRQALVDFLTDARNLPVYMKRSFGAYGRGNVLVAATEGKQLILGNGSREDASVFAASVDDGKVLGWLLQAPLTSHARIQALTHNNKISGLRLHTFMTPDDVVLTRAVFKVNAGARDSDNFEHGKSGNLLAAVDTSTGVVTRAYQRLAGKHVVNPVHPVTGQAIVGFQVPFWQEARELALNAHRAFPGFICPGWDIAICDDGPTILEVNAFGDTDLSQYASQTGFLDGKFMQLLKARGMDGLLARFPKAVAQTVQNSRKGARRSHWLW